MMKNSASAFMFIVNEGSGGDKVIGCSMKGYPAVRGELHDVIKGEMTKVEEITIPPQKTTELKKGGLHLMFFNLPESLSDYLTLILNFKQAVP